jgi:non-heme Fe2+,alpha-ketoglutarate-dependent halogenase
MAARELVACRCGNRTGDEALTLSRIHRGSGQARRHFEVLDAGPTGPRVGFASLELSAVITIGRKPMSVVEQDDYSLTQAEIDSFKENGYLGPFTLYSPEEAIQKWSQAKIEMVLSPNKPHNSTILNYDRHLDCKTLSDHVCHPKIVGKLRSLMGEDILCWKTNIFPKYPGEEGTGWHQVETFRAGQSGVTPRPALKYTEKTPHVTSEITVWTAFTPSQREHACMTFIPGSHKKWFYDETKPLKSPIEAKRHDFFGYDYSELKIDDEWDPDSQEITKMAMDAGQFVIFVAKCVHGSLPNTSDQMRLGYASRYVAPSVQVYDGVEQISQYGEKIDLSYFGCVQVSGKDRYNLNRIYDKNLNGHVFPKHF